MWLGLVPGVLAVGLSVPSVEGVPLGVEEALGCSGGPNLAQRWTSLGPMSSRDSSGAVAIASDGFFVIGGSGNDLSVEAAQAELRVVVTDDGGAEVLGDLSLLRSDWHGFHLFGWEARAPLAVGARLTATLATEPATDSVPRLGGEYPLRVEGEPTSPSAPEATFSRWGRVYADGGGELVACQVSESCGRSEVLSVPARVVEQVSAFADWRPPEVVGSVAWSVRVEAAWPEGEAAGEHLWFGGVGQYAPTGKVPLVEIGSVNFRERAERYCVDVILEDLRSGLEQRKELCSGAGALERFASRAGIGRCDDPPSAELTPLWCRLKPGALELPLCEAYRDGRSTAADAGTPSSDASKNSVKPTADSSSFGCAMGSPRSRRPAVATLSALALTSLARRRLLRRALRAQ